MQIQVNIEELRKNKLFVATPMYGGMSHGLYVKSCLDLQTVMMRYGIEVKFSFLFNESLITRARNYLVDEFLRTDFTHMLFIDSDIHFDPNDARESIQEAVSILNQQVKQTNRGLGFRMDEILNAPVVTVVSESTGEVVRQIPNEVVVRVAHNIERMKGFFFNSKA
jgi:uncharacterized FlaG/YvyC family protein